MNDLFAQWTRAGFGPCHLTEEPSSPPPPSIYLLTATKASALRARVGQEAPRRPGVYGMWDEHGEIVYIGKARCLRTRLLSYFRPKSRDPKAGRILRASRAIGWETMPDEFGALLRELELIRRWRPRFNVQGQPFRRRLTYVCVGRGPAPYVFLSARPAVQCLCCHGPVSQGARAREAVRRINDWFGLRDCPQWQLMHFSDQEELFPLDLVAGCPRYELQTCVGPCAGACTRADYMKRVRQVRAFLQGGDSPILSAMERKMSAASVALQYEYAAALRDQLASVQWLRGQLERLQQAARDYSFIYPVCGHNHHDRWYLIQGGRVVGVLPWPRDDEAHLVALRAVREVYGKTNIASIARAARQGYSGSLPIVEELDGVYLVSSWFRRHPKELERVLRPKEIAGSGARTIR